jgi:hypothetical protein
MRYILLWISILAGLPGIGLRSIQAQKLMVGSQLELPYANPTKKITILECWSIKCVACLRAFPELERLQSTFNEEIEMVLVSLEPEEEVNFFFKTHPNLRRPLLRCVYEDTTFIKKDGYPLPFQVWINSVGYIVAMPDIEQVNEELIKQALSGKAPAIQSVRKSKVNSSLLEAGTSAWKGPVLYYSYLARCSETISVGHQLVAPAEPGMVRISEDCASVLELYKIAYAEKGKFHFYNDFNVELNVANPDLFRKPRNRTLYGLWKANYAYSYDISVPAARSGEIFRMMQDDLARNFGLKAEVGKGRF